MKKTPAIRSTARNAMCGYMANISMTLKRENIAENMTDIVMPDNIDRIELTTPARDNKLPVL